VEQLGGRYITAEDVGTSPDDLEHVRVETAHVVGLRGRSGDPSPVTAYGVYEGIRAAARFRWGSDSLEGRHITVQGLGHVGAFLCLDLHAAGAKLTVTDIDPEKVKRAVEDLGASGVAPDDIYDVQADVFAPCALGAVVNDRTLPRLQVEIVAGSANNQLEDDDVHGPALRERGILYAPDYVINAGGLINVYGELRGWPLPRAREKAKEIHHTLLEIFAHAEQEGTATSAAADRIAERRLQEARHRQGTPPC
jgi:leucine dehydrogenase